MFRGSHSYFLGSRAVAWVKTELSPTAQMPQFRTTARCCGRCG